MTITAVDTRWTGTPLDRPHWLEGDTGFPTGGIADTGHNPGAASDRPYSESAPAVPASAVRCRPSSDSSPSAPSRIASAKAACRPSVCVSQMSTCGHRRLIDWMIGSSSRYRLARDRITARYTRGRRQTSAIAEYGSSTSAHVNPSRCNVLSGTERHEGEPMINARPVGRVTGMLTPVIPLPRGGSICAGFYTGAGGKQFGRLQHAS